MGGGGPTVSEEPPQVENDCNIPAVLVSGVKNS